MADIRTCNVCVGRSVGGLMHFCSWCCSYVCTRKKCMAEHATKCGKDMGDPRPVIKEVRRSDGRPDSIYEVR